MTWCQLMIMMEYKILVMKSFLDCFNRKPICNCFNCDSLYLMIPMLHVNSSHFCQHDKVTERNERKAKHIFYIVKFQLLLIETL